MSDEPISRQEFLKQGFQSLLSNLLEHLPGMNGPSTETDSLRPPGAVLAQQFLSTCEPFCQLCQDACPKQAIHFDVLGYPVIEPEVSPCVMCVDVPCTKVCPTGALQPLTDPRQIAMGKARIELTVCSAYTGSGCHVCYDSCPLIDEAIQLVEGLPQINMDHCTGCGVCVYDCPTPGSIMVYAG